MAIVFAVLLPVVGMSVIGLHGNRSLEIVDPQVIFLIVGGLAIALLGALDDVRQLRARTKLMVQLLIALMAYWFGFRFQKFGLPFVGVTQLPIWLDLPLSVLWITGVVNAINLIDGLDGLAAGVTFFVALTNLVLSLQFGNDLGAFFAAVISGAVLGFLLFNWNPAIVFMGDSGSMFLGYILSTTSILTSQKVSTTMAMMIPLIALGVPVMDTLLSVVRRFLEKRPIFSPDKGHLHHRLLKSGLTHKNAVLAIYGLCIVFAATAIGLTATKDVEAAIAMVVLAVVIIGIIRFFGFFRISRIRSANKSPLLEKLRPKLPSFVAMVVNQPTSVDHIWTQLCQLCHEIGIRDLDWTTVGLDPTEVRSESFVPGDTRKEIKAAQKGFATSRNTVGLIKSAYLEIRYVFPAIFGKDSRDADIALQLLSDAVGSALRNLMQQPNCEFNLSSASCEDPDQPALVESSQDDLVLALTRKSTDQYEKPTVPANPNVDPEQPLSSEIMFEQSWEKLVRLCEDSGFCEVSWKTIGLETSDSRKAEFNENLTGKRSTFRRSVPVSQMAFVEIDFIYPKKTGDRRSDEVRKAIRTITNTLTHDFFKYHRQLEVQK